MPKPFPEDFVEQAQAAYDAISMKPIQGAYFEHAENGCCPLTAVALANDLIDNMPLHEMDNLPHTDVQLAEALGLQLGEVQAFIEAYDCPMSTNIALDTVVAQQALLLAQAHYNNGEPY
jgi:hypothetical protein